VRVAVQEACRHQIRGPWGQARHSVRRPGYLASGGAALALRARRSVSRSALRAIRPAPRSALRSRSRTCRLFQAASRARGPGPVLPAQPGHRRQHDGSKGHSLKNGGFAAYDPAQPGRSAAKPRDRDARRPVASEPAHGQPEPASAATRADHHLISPFPPPDHGSRVSVVKLQAAPLPDRPGRARTDRPLYRRHRPIAPCHAGARKCSPRSMPTRE
jgi:hypothetical protein